MNYAINYDAVIQDFFAGIDSMLKRNIAIAGSNIKAIDKNISRIMMLANNPQKFTNLRLMEVNGLFVTPDGFYESGEQLGVKLFEIYNAFIDCIRQYYNSQDVDIAKEQMLLLYKKWKQFAGRDNCVRNFVYNRLKPEFFCAKFRTAKTR